MSDRPDLLTMAEASELTRTPMNTLRYYRHRDDGPVSFRLGKRVMYLRSDLERWIEDARRTELAARNLHASDISTASSA